ncbi:MAG: hypothetical protein AAFV72_17925 [Cyanobacteria bacterium J06635_1]
MTHTTVQTNVDKQQLADNLNQIKAEGGVRFKKVAQIFRAAFVESATELKEGATTVSPAAKDLKDSVSQLIAEASKEAVAEAKDVWANRSKEESLMEWFRAEVRAIFKAIKTTFSAATHPADTSEDVLTPVKLNATEDSSVQTVSTDADAA